MSSKTWALRLCLMMLAVSMAVASPELMFASSPGNSFDQHNLVSDLPGVASYMDPDLVNPWGVAFSGTSPFWVADNGAGLATLYNSTGVKQGLVVTIPGVGGSAPTGQVFNPNPANFGGSHFIFSTEDGTIAAWSSGTNAALSYTSPIGAVYKGLALAAVGSNTYIYATDFHNGTIDVFDSGFNKVSLGSFTDPTLPAGYAPFGIQTSGGLLYVTYALQDAAKHDDVACPGCGVLDVFNPDGTLMQHLVAVGGALNSPWGMAWAPSGFGKFGGDLLVGNFGDGTINVFDPASGTWLAQLDDPNGNPVTNLGLWNIGFGNGGNGGFKNILYFTAGIPGPGQIEDHGLFGELSSVPEPGTLTLLGSGLASLIGLGWRKGKRTA